MFEQIDSFNVFLNLLALITTLIVAALGGYYIIRSNRRSYDAATIASQDKRIATLELDFKTTDADRNNLRGELDGMKRLYENDIRAHEGTQRAISDKMETGFAERDARIESLERQMREGFSARDARIDAFADDNVLMKRAMRTQAGRIREYEKYCQRMGLPPLEFENDDNLHDRLTDVTVQSLRDDTDRQRQRNEEQNRREEQQNRRENAEDQRQIEEAKPRTIIADTIETQGINVNPSENLQSKQS